MKMCATVLVSCLILGSFAGTTQAFPTSSRGAGQVFYRTGTPVPDKYLADGNIIHNYHHYHLEKPGDGYIWAHGEENDYLLISIKSHILKRIDSRPYIPRANDG